MSTQKYARPRKRVIDQTAVAQYLATLGFAVEKISQEWRHLTAFGTYQNQPAVFKLASTQRTAPYTQNEYRWNEAVHRVPESKRPNFTVPKNLATGTFANLFYLITTRFPGELLVQAKQLLSQPAMRQIQHIAAATREIELLPLPSTGNFARLSRIPRTAVGQEIVDSSVKWASYVPLNLDPFLKIVDGAKTAIRTCPIHGDFVIRHLFLVNGKIGAIDGEHARRYGPNHFDVAQYYIRLRHDHTALTEARQYLQHFYELLPTADQKTFWQELKPPLIQRYIGDLWGAAKNPRRLAQLQPLGNEILHDTVLD